MNESTFVVRYFDTDIQEEAEYEFHKLLFAQQTYEELAAQKGVENIRILEYNYTDKQYYLCNC